MKSSQCVTGTLHSGPHSMAEVLGLFQLAEQARKLGEWGIAVPEVDSHTPMIFRSHGYICQKIAWHCTADQFHSVTVL